MFHDVVTTHPSIKNAIAKRDAAVAEREALYPRAKAEHKAWLEEVADLPLGSKMPPEPPGVVSYEVEAHAKRRVAVAEGELKAAISSNYSEVFEAVKQHEAQLIDEAREVAVRLSEIGKELTAMQGAMQWMDRTSDQRRQHSTYAIDATDLVRAVTGADVRFDGTFLRTI